MKRRTSNFNERLGLMFKPGQFSEFIRAARIAAGWTLKEVSVRTGISPSEIYKLETGNRECRLESLVYICAALGVPAGRLLDEITVSMVSHWSDLSSSPAFRSIAERYGIEDPSIVEVLSDNLRSCCGLGLHLLRCSQAARLAGKIDYRGVKDLKTRFVVFAETVDAIESSKERLKLAESFIAKPIETLVEHHLLSDQFVESIINERPAPTYLTASLKKFAKPDTIPSGRSVWVPMIILSSLTGDSAGESGITFSVDNLQNIVNRSAVTPTWNQVVERAKAATTAPGSKGKLAERLGVPQSRLSEWLGGKYEPGAGVAFQLLHWVEKLEVAQKQMAAGARTQAAVSTPKGKSDEPKQGRRKT